MPKEVKRPKMIGLLGLGFMFVWCISILYLLPFIHHHHWMMQAFGWISALIVTTTNIGLAFYMTWLEGHVWPRKKDPYNGYYE
jgi:drug/metabolite transporter (DMT)-like permease